MSNVAPHIHDVIVIGAGHAGLSSSYFLSENKLPHIVLERGQVGESWHSQRWDSFTLNTPNHMNRLPGERNPYSNPEGFLRRDEVVTKLKNYADCFQLPVQEHATATSITKLPGADYFSVNAICDHQEKKWMCKQVVIASGAMSAPVIPSMSHCLSGTIFQLHVAQYRNASLLPEGAVMIVGGGQSGCQVAEDLVAGGRTVYLASSKVGRVPRRYRGKDVFDWLTRMKYYDVLRDTVTHPNEFTVTTPLVSGVGRRGHTISLQSLHKQGVRILGRLKKIENDTIIFDTHADEHVRCGDNFSENIKAKIDDYILQSGIPADESEEDEADQPDINASCVQLVSSFNCNDKNINTVIWTTGFTGDFSWIHLPVLTHDGEPIHHNGVSPVPGLYFIGFPWLRSRKSGILYGIKEDAAFIVSEIMKYQS
jgi:putative flavoprotein involved in K+ transport